MGRRQKQASDAPHTLLRLREEVIVLKELDVAKMANDHLFKQMIKTKRIREAEAFVALFGEQPKVPGPTGAAEANVLGRLFKTRPVMEVVPGIMEGIRQVLGLDETKSATTAPKETKGANKPGARNESERVESLDDADDFAGFSDQPSKEANGAASDGSDLDETELDSYNHRLAASDESEDEDDANELDPMEISDIDEGQNHDRTPSLPDSSYSDDSDENTRPRHRKSTTLPQVPAGKTISSTAFLPSLSMSGYYSGSESSDNNDLSHGGGPALPKDRKNRRGQRARQQLAELKYGQNAKHLLQQQKKQRSNGSSGGRDAGWDAKRGAVDGQGQRQQKKFGMHQQHRKQSRGPVTTMATGANEQQQTARKKKDGDGPLHPSWEAAKMKKKMQEGGGAAFAGKKITFD